MARGSVATTRTRSAEQSRQQTAKKAAEMLANRSKGFIIPTSRQKKNLVVEFAKQDMVVYGRAFDLVKAPHSVDLDNLDEVAQHLKEIVLYEIKSTARRNVASRFKGYFFALTTAELLVAQNLKDQYKFAFVNTLSGECQEWDLSEIFANAKAIYPTWSISF